PETPTTIYLYENYKCSNLKPALSLRLPDQKTEIYSAITHSLHKPNIEIFRAHSPKAVATITFHSFSATDISFTNGAGDVSLKNEGTLHRDYVFHFGGQEYHWTGHHTGRGSGGDMKLVDAKGTMIAVYELAVNTTSATKQGKFSVLVGRLSEEVLEVVLATAIAILGKEKKQASQAGMVGDAGGAIASVVS
ncbi:hypothetical protein HK097_003025, partial [Rhizophlyctis rosea]